MAAPLFVFTSPYPDGTSDASSENNVFFLLPEAIPGFGPVTGGVDFDVSGGNLTEGWAWFYVDIDWQTINTALVLLSGATNDVFRIIASNTESFGSAHTQKAQYWNGSSWVDIGSDFSQTLSTQSRVDIHWSIAASGGKFEVFVNQKLEASFTGDTTVGDNSVGTVRLQSPYASTGRQPDFSVLVVDNADTRGLEWDTGIPNANGSLTGWTNGEPQIDNYIFQTNSQIDFVEADADGEQFTVDFPVIDSGFSAYSVEAVLLVADAAGVATPPRHLQALAYKSATTYQITKWATPDGTDRRALNWYLTTNPETDAAWASQAEVEAFEFGLEAYEVA